MKKKYRSVSPNVIKEKSIKILLSYGSKYESKVDHFNVLSELSYDNFNGWKQYDDYYRDVYNKSLTDGIDNGLRYSFRVDLEHDGHAIEIKSFSNPLFGNSIVCLHNHDEFPWQASANWFDRDFFHYFIKLNKPTANIQIKNNKIIFGFFDPVEVGIDDYFYENKDNEDPVKFKKFITKSIKKLAAKKENKHAFLTYKVPNGKYYIYEMRVDKKFLNSLKKQSEEVYDFWLTRQICGILISKKSDLAI